MEDLLRKEHALEIAEKKQMEIKKNLISNAAKKQEELFIDDSTLVEAMFDFLPDSSSETPTPIRGTSVFMVRFYY